MSIGKLTLFVVLVCLDSGLSQRDCTGVDCPVLQNCIEEVLEAGACCTACVRKGCTCEGYQYYDCVNAGFQKGKVPQGKSYFVDFGSTECSCPQGGGKISCRFIPCPDIPPNCIEVAQPQDGCPQCARVGCVQGNKKYEAGHSFQMDPCRVCHCPNDGGSLMCSPVPGCDPHSARKPTLVTTTENNSPPRDGSRLHDSRQTNPLEPFPKLAPGSNTLPLYKQDPPNSGTEDYDYTLPEPTTSAPQEPVQPPESSAAPPALPESGSTSTGFHDNRRQELKEKLVVVDQARGDGAGNPRRLDQSTTRAQEETPTSSATTQRANTESRGPQQEAGERATRRHRDRVHQDALKDTAHTADADKGVRRTGGHHKHRENQNRHTGGGHGGGHGGGQSGARSQAPVDHRQPLDFFPTVQFSPTRKAPVRVREEGDKDRRQPQTLYNYQNGEGDDEVSAKELVEVCCETGEKWATVNRHCDDMELPRKDRHSICRTAQKQCCLGSLRESQCSAGMNTARVGGVCAEDAGDKCGADFSKECCSCCSLGLRFREGGHRCEAHQYLGYPCSHVFLTCCEGVDGEQGEGGGWHTVRERPSSDPTALPKRVSDSPFPKEAFSIGEDQDGENTVEGPPEAVDECELHRLCEHRCIATPGSFRCQCHPGYQLLQDGLHCAQGTADQKENRLKEDDRAEVEPTSPPTPPTSPPPAPTQPPAPLDPCEGNGPCLQQCLPVAGRPHCACFPGFTLMADRQSCEDVNECLSPRACRPGERCVNTEGSYVCARQVTCAPGHYVNGDVCQDINECAQGTHTCGHGFDCVNTEGSFRCDLQTHCSAGFTQNTHGSCIDIDECGGVAPPCSPGFNCINTMGSYSCQRKIIMCSRGYHASPDGARCTDVDECQANLHRCGEGQLCHNLPGSYRCDCQTGYQYDQFRRTCVDVNECWRYPGRLCSQTCDNTPGSYSCSCTAGFRLSTDGKNCEDVDECLTNPCSQECANIYGSYQCYCRAGYRLRGDGHMCEDIDECSQSVGHLCSYKCLNVAGSYQCTCPEHGYTMSPNGRSCRDIDECTTGANNCSLAETCYNVQGGHRCLSLDCPHNYRKVSDTRCERISCPSYLDCQNSPLRITYYYLSFQSNIVIPAQIFRIGPSPAYSGDNVIISITQGNEENYFSTRKLNTYTGAVYLHRQVREPRDFLVDVEMKLWRQGAFTTFLARIYVFIMANSL